MNRIPLGHALSHVTLCAIVVLGGIFSAEISGAPEASAASRDAIEVGRRMYMEGTLPTGEMLSATLGGDIRVTGNQVVCGSCHRRSGMGSSEGQEVVPAVTGEILFNPLRLPASKPPATPMLRPAYTDATLKRAIREGVDANGDPLSLFMPRYALGDEQLEPLIAYLKTLNTGKAPGVTDREIHFATITADSAPAARRKALLDVMRVFFERKNAGTRHESRRADNAPWHKDTVMKSYRKWVLHEWRLQGAAETWKSQLESYYLEQPVFAVLTGVADGSWRPVHDFCKQEQLPCLFPTTDLPVVDDQDFYSIYLSQGLSLEGEAVVQHLADEGHLARPVVQVYRQGDVRAEAAAHALRRGFEGRGGRVTDVALLPRLQDDAIQDVLPSGMSDPVWVLWLNDDDAAGVWPGLDVVNRPDPIYLSTTLYGTRYDNVPVGAREVLYFVSPTELPDRLPQLLVRATSWLRANRIYSAEEGEIQANAYFTLKMAGAALEGIHTYFSREYFLENIEHMVDNAVFTSVYPRVSLAPEQRFIAKGCYIARPGAGEGGQLQAVTEWLIPGSR